VRDLVAADPDDESGGRVAQLDLHHGVRAVVRHRYDPGHRTGRIPQDELLGPHHHHDGTGGRFGQDESAQCAVDGAPGRLPGQQHRIA
jgi:hypothetical protein